MMTQLCLPVLVDLPAALGLADLLREAKGPVAIDGSGVERIGVAGLQLLLSAQASAVAGGHGFAIDRPSDALAAAARTAGAECLLTSAR